MDHSTLAGHAILVVEPDVTTARNLHRTLEGAGAQVLHASNADDTSLGDAVPAGLSAAVLDYTQSIRDRHRLARRLTSLTIPFVFCKDIGRNEAWPQAAVLNKPFGDAELVQLLRRLLQAEDGRAVRRAGEPSDQATAGPARQPQ
jgi:CheY-like chemotaxis protein